MLRSWLPALSIVLIFTPQIHANEAKELFDRGTALYESGEYQQAADTFREANRLSPNWKILFNIGQCEALSKRHGLALQAFEAYLSKGGDDINIQREAEVRQEIKRLQQMTGLLKIEAPKGAIVTIDDVKRGTAPIVGQIPVAASVEHTVSVASADSKIEQQTVMVVGGQTVVVNFLPQTAPEKSVVSDPVAPPVPNVLPQTVPSANEKSSLGKWGMVTLGLSGGFLIAGTITGIVSTTKLNTLVDRCPDNTCTGPSDQSLKEEVDSLALATDILLPIGGALALTGVLLLVADKKRNQQERPVSHRKIQLRPMAGGMVLKGSF